VLFEGVKINRLSFYEPRKRVKSLALSTGGRLVGSSSFEGLASFRRINGQKDAIGRAKKWSQTVGHFVDDLLLLVTDLKGYRNNIGHSVISTKLIGVESIY
jgi:hypothetical protein